ncbi:hypothetical protein [Absidia glauca]|uniref:Reverse transcriptase domain-containing protein n=1 Tax=Absidia glauca TaxID=4829 RepID=A0A168NSZ3_ABSGL|nr:hypothetical protein [Absidia glauca]
MATPWGNYSYQVMPFGIVNRPSTFARCIYMALEPFMGRFATSYIDDITIYSDVLDKQLEHIEAVLKRLVAVGLKVKPSKCLWLQDSIKLLGFVVDKDGNRIDTVKVDKIMDFPVPTNKTAVRAFVNLAGYYWRHVQAFSTWITSNLMNLGQAMRWKCLLVLPH